MSAITRWNPFGKKQTPLWDPLSELEDMRNRLEGWFSNPLALRGNGPEESLIDADWAPSVDISENDKEYHIKAELPGVDKKDVKVSADNGVLTISGERKTEKEEKNKKQHRIECSYGNFVRRFALPDTVDPADIKADFKNGVLNVRLTKSEPEEAKAIDVKVG